MIHLTRLNGDRFLLNAELIRYVEACPDTFVSMIDGERVVVRETIDEVLRRTVEYQRSKFLYPFVPPAHVPNVAAAPQTSDQV